MARGADLTKVLDPQELARVRALIAEQMPAAEMSASGQSYPRMLFHQEYVNAQKSWCENPDPLLKKVAAEKMQAATTTVFDAEEEAEFLEDGWRKSPADFMAIDPRIPVGREAKRVAAQQKMSREEEIEALMLRLAELRGEPVLQAPSGESRQEEVIERSAAPRRRGKGKKRRPSRLRAAKQNIADAFGEPAPPATQS